MHGIFAILFASKDCLQRLRRVACDNILGNGIGTTNLAKHAGAAAREAFLRLRVKLNQAKARLPALIPLEIVHQRPVQVATHRYPILNSLMYHRQVFQNRSWSPIIVSIVEAILRNIERLIAPRAPIDLTQHTIETLWIDFPEAIMFIQPGIVTRCVRTDKTPAEEF